MKSTMKLRSIFVAVLAIVFVVPAFGQQTGSRLDRNANAPRSVSDTGIKSAIVVAHGFGFCLARREGSRVQTALDFPLMSAEQNKAMDRYFDKFDGCLGASREFDELRSGSLLTLGGAAEWFIGTKLKKANLASLTGMTDEALMKTEFRPRTDLEDFGLCVVRKDIPNAQLLLTTKPTTEAEKKAIKVLKDNLGSCVSVGTEMKLTTPIVRAVIALAIYRAASKIEAVE